MPNQASTSCGCDSPRITVPSGASESAISTFLTKPSMKRAAPRLNSSSEWLRCLSCWSIRL